MQVTLGGRMGLVTAGRRTSFGVGYLVRLFAMAALSGLLWVAAGAQALSTFMGHASITITLDRYGHLFPGAEDAAAGLLDAYLERANTQARLAALDA